MCIPDVLRALTEATIVFVAALLSGTALVVLRCVFAAADYLAGADSDDKSLQDIFTSDEVWDWQEASYWLWALAVVLVAWGVILALLCMFKGIRATWNFLVDWTWSCLRRLFVWCCCTSRVEVQQQDADMELDVVEHHHHHYHTEPPPPPASTEELL